MTAVLILLFFVIVVSLSAAKPKMTDWQAIIFGGVIVAGSLIGLLYMSFAR